jgi:hypothetical protein
LKQKLEQAMGNRNDEGVKAHDEYCFLTKMRSPKRSKQRYSERERTGNKIHYTWYTGTGARQNRPISCHQLLSSTTII